MKNKIVTLAVVTLLITSGITVAQSFDTNELSFESSSDLTGQNDVFRNLVWNSDGTSLIVLDTVSDELMQFTLSEPYNPATASLDTTKDVTWDFGNPRGLGVGKNGEILYITYANDDYIHQYNLTTPYDIDTASRQNFVDISGNISSPANVLLNDTGDIMYIADEGANDNIVQYSLSNNWQISSLSHTRNLDVSGQMTNAFGLDINNNGSKLFVSDSTANTIYTYTMGTNYDLSTASFSTSTNIGGTLSNPSGIKWNEVGTKLWVSNGSSISTYVTYDAIVSGYVKDANDNPVSSATIQFNASVGSVQTNSNGYYEVGVNNGDYSVNATKSGYTTDQTTLSVSGSDIPNTNFTIEKEFTVSGTIKNVSGSPLDNATVSINDTSISDTVTGSNGGYSFVVTNGTYLIEASKTNYLNDSITVTIAGTGKIDQNITLSKTPTIEGYIIDASGDPVENATVVINGSSAPYTTGSDGFYIFSEANGNYHIETYKDGYVNDQTTVTIANNQDVTDANLTLSGIRLDVNNFMKHGTTQTYEVILLRNDSNINSLANVTSHNLTVVTVNESRSELIATSNQSINQRINITAAYQNASVNQSVTVANRTLDNINIMPSSQWVTSVLGFDEEQAQYGIGSEIQWIFLSVITGAMVAWGFRNEWVGLGVITFEIIVWWVLGYVSIGILMVAVFYAIFAGYQLQKTPSRSDTNVGGFR